MPGVNLKVKATHDSRKTGSPSQNVPGPFFVENEHCIACGAPEHEAPDLMAHDEGGHCYFKRQPSTPQETEQAIQAVWVSCCGAVRYEGNDPNILQRFAELKQAFRLRMGEAEWKRHDFD